jgi:hypothetical protein
MRVNFWKYKPNQKSHKRIPTHEGWKMTKLKRFAKQTQIRNAKSSNKRDKVQFDLTKTRSSKLKMK